MKNTSLKSLQEGASKKQLILTAFVIILCVFFFVSLFPSDVHALSVFDELGRINYAESLGFVFLMTLMALFVSEIPMIFFGNTGMLSKGDVIEKLTFRLSTGLAVIVLALEVTFLGFALFAQIAWVLTLLGSVMFFVRNRRLISRLYTFFQTQEKSRNIRFRFQLIKMRARLAPIVVTFVLMGILMFQASTIVNGYVGSTNFDASHHTLIIKSYLDMNMVEERPQPYYNFIIRYSRGPYTLSAYAITVLSVPVQKIVALMTLLFFALNMLALYTLGKTVFGNQWMGLLALVLGSSSQNLWSPISWGGLPFAMGLFSTLVGLSLTLRFVENAQGLKDAVFLGLILFLAIFSYPTSVLFTFAWLFLSLVAILARALVVRKKTETNVRIRRLVILTFVACVLALALSLSYMQTLNHELQSWLINPAQGSFPELVTAQPSYLEEVQWVIDKARQLNPLNPFDTFSFSLLHGYLLFFASVVPFAIIILWLMKDSSVIKNEDKRKVVPLHLKAILFYVLFIFILFYLRDIGNIRLIEGYPFNDLIPPARVFQSFFVPLSLLSAVSVYAMIVSLIAASRALLKNYAEKKWQKRINEFFSAPHFKREMYALLLTICLLLYLGGYAGYYFQTNEVQSPDFATTFGSIFGYFNRLSASDLALMDWMKINMKGNEVIFINWQDGGEYVSAVTGLKAIYVLSPLFESTKYKGAVYSLATKPSGLSWARQRMLIEFLRDYNITHVFVGSNGLSPRWNGTTIAQFPYLEIVKNYGDSYLFRVKLSSNIVYF